jgi:ParB/RepB/Spo0J family partition protein
MATTTNPVTEETGDLAIAIPPGAKWRKTQLITRTQIHPDPDQPRKHADAELRNSIARNGLLQPITVRPHPTILTEFMIVDGERRWRSSEGVLEDLVCIVRNDQDELVRRIATQLEANTGKPLTPMEEVRAFKQLIDTTGWSPAELADFLGRARSTVAERVGLLELAPWLPAIEGGAVPMSHVVRVLLPLRALDDEIHAKVVQEMYDGDFAPDPDGHESRVDDFRRSVMLLYKPYLYPLTKSKEYSARNPEFNTSKHDKECGCGGIKVAIGYERERVYCGNPEWWRPLDRAAKKAKRAREEKAGGGVRKGGKTLHLPEGTKQVKSNYGQTPPGVVQLTDTNGEWAVSSGYGRNEQPFDPADLSIDDAKLVQWQPSYGSGYPNVGTRDAAAVKAARAKWAARWDAERTKLLEKFGEQLREQMGLHQVEGAGASVIAGMLSEEYLTAAIDVAEALGWQLPDSLTKGERYERLNAAEKWLGSLTMESASTMLTALATVAEHKLKLPTERIEQLQQSALGNIRKRTVPWKTKPKDSTAAKGKAKSARKSKRPDREVALPLDDDDDDEVPVDYEIVDADGDDDQDLWDAESEEELEEATG